LIIGNRAISRIRLDLSANLSVDLNRLPGANGQITAISHFEINFGAVGSYNCLAFTNYISGF
jgi:hypothetical protein